MRIAIISDLHANLPALQAVLPVVETADRVLCCGDIVGYYADPNEVCSEIRRRGYASIRGNHDAYVLGALTATDEVLHLSHTHWTRRSLSQENIDWLAGLPLELDIHADPWNIQLRHASPWDEVTHLYADSPRLQDVAVTDSTICIFGHTHRPFFIKKGGGWLVNAGSVGQPRDGLASTVIMIDTQKAEPEIIRIPYDVDAYCHRLETLGWEWQLIEALRRSQKGQ